MAKYFKLVWKPEAYTRTTGNPVPVGTSTTNGYIAMSDGEWVETDITPADNRLSDCTKVIGSLRGEVESLKNECKRLRTSNNSTYRNTAYPQAESPRNIVDSDGRRVSARRQAMKKNKLVITF